MKTKIFIGMSLDGFIARKNGDISWLTQFANEEVTRAYEKFISGIDVVVIGRKTYEKVLTFPSWPYIQKVFVLSNSIKQIPGSSKNAPTVLSMEPEELLKFLSAKGYKDVYIDGGKVIQSFLRSDLIDEMTISTVPVLLGDGIPLFGYLEKDIHLEHKNTEVYSNGLVRSFFVRKVRPEY